VSARATLASRPCSDTWIKRVEEFRFCGLFDEADVSSKSGMSDERDAYGKW
jgi:hypothetical protein